MDQPLLLRLAAGARERPGVVDAALAGAVVLFTVVYPAQLSAYQPDQSVAAVLGLLLTVPLAWRRRAPVPAAAVVVVAGLLELGATESFLAANVAAPAMVYALAAYAPRWASRAGLGIGLLGAVLAAGRWYSSGQLDSAGVAAVAIGVLVVACWALGDLRRARLQQLAGQQERARLLELERA
jgi:hypothetical protein